MFNQLASFDLVAVDNASTQQQHHDFFLLPESRVVISGVVRHPDGSPVQGAVVQFFRKEGKNIGPPIGHIFTDEDGQFLFGPLVPGTKFKVKIFYWDNMAKGKQIDVSTSGIFPPVVVFPPISTLPPVATLPPPATIMP
jgi:hypothetical protein